MFLRQNVNGDNLWSERARLEALRESFALEEAYVGLLLQGRMSPEDPDLLPLVEIIANGLENLVPDSERHARAVHRKAEDYRLKRN